MSPSFSQWRRCPSTRNNLQTTLWRKWLEEKEITLSYYWRNIYSPSFYCTIKIMRSNSKNYRRKFLSSFRNHKISDTSLMHNNVYHNNFIVIIFFQQSYKMIVKNFIHSATSHGFLSSFWNHKISVTSFVHNNVYHKKLIVIIFVL
jgi:hypothetical protein